MTLSTMSRCLLAAALAVATPLAGADEFTDRANGLYATIRSAKRSDTVLLPLVAKLEEPPAAAATAEKAMLLPAGSAAWDATAKWAQAAPQRAVIDGVDQVTKEERPDEAMAFGQPYGAAALGAAGAELVKAGLYTDLGDPPMLAAAKFPYLDALERVECLMNVEATRLSADGHPDQALGIMTDWLFMARQMADRQMYPECRWGIRSMTRALERIRDIVYVDSRGPKKLTIEQILAVLERLRIEGGFLRLDRLRFPEANRIAAEQVIAAVISQRSGPAPEFGKTMARLASTRRPLRLFAEVARWDSIAANHANWFDTRDELKKVYDDLAGRWPLDDFNPRSELQSDLEKMDTDEFAVLSAVLPDMSPLIADRRILRTNAVGTRCALGTVAFALWARNFPPILDSIRPRFARTIEADPFNSERARGSIPALQFFVPIRDQKKNEREIPKPHEINVTARGHEAFPVKLGDDQFVLYSVGPNDEKEWAVNSTNEPEKDADGDILLWPPVLSLLREHMVQAGALK